MAFTAYFCNSDTPWIGGNGVLGIAWITPDNGVFSISITGTLATGPAYTFTTNVTVNTANATGAYPYGKALKAGTYTVVVTEALTSATQSYSFVINDYPEVFSVNCTPTQPSCSQTEGYVTFGYNTGAFSTMQYCVHSIAVIPSNPNCNCGLGKLTIGKGQVTTSCFLAPGTYHVFLENNSVSCSFNISTPTANYSFSVGGVANGGYCEFTINPPTQKPLNISVSSADTLCDTSVGSITVNSIDGVGPYVYSWTGPNGFTSSNEDLTGLEAGTYVLEVTDSNGCTGTVTVNIASIQDQNNCIPPVICYKAVNCNSDCFGTKVYYLTGADVSALSGYIINGLQIEGEVIDPTYCWQILPTDPSESIPPVPIPCYIDADAGVQSILRNCQVIVNGTNIYTGNPIQANTADFVSAIIAGGLSNGFVASAGSTATQFDICPPDESYNNAFLTIAYEWYDQNVTKSWILVSINIQFGAGSPGTGCYDAFDFQGYYTVFSSCELCAPAVCPEEPPFVKIIPDPVKIYYQIRESKCDITATKQFATAYSNMLKKIKYGIADCCNGLNIAETWVNKQISNLQATVVPGYNCRSIPMEGCNWLPIQGCELLVSPTDGTSILVIAGEDLVYAKLVMLLGDGKAYLNQPLVTNNYQRAIGFTTMDVQMNHSTRVLVNGIITNPSWSLITGAIYYAAPNGGITTTVPNTGISQVIGIAINATSLFVDIKQPNILC